MSRQPTGQMVPDPLRFSELAPACVGLNVTAESRPARGNVVLVLCRGFAGTNGALLLRAAS